MDKCHVATLEGAGCRLPYPPALARKSTGQIAKADGSMTSALALFATSKIHDNHFHECVVDFLVSNGSATSPLLQTIALVSCISSRKTGSTTSPITATSKSR